jgi:hypothetical protein
MTEDKCDRADKITSSERSGVVSRDDECVFAIQQIAGAFNETGSVTPAALLNLLRLMGAELVLNQGRCDTERLEQVVRTKIGQFLSPSNQTAQQAGLAYAKHLVEQLMAQIRVQAQLQKSIKPVLQRNRNTAQNEAASSALPRLLN